VTGKTEALYEAEVMRTVNSGKNGYSGTQQARIRCHGNRPAPPISAAHYISWHSNGKRVCGASGPQRFWSRP